MVLFFVLSSRFRVQPFPDSRHQGRVSHRWVGSRWPDCHHHRRALLRRSPGLLWHHTRVVGAHHAERDQGADAPEGHARHRRGHVGIQNETFVQGNSWQIHLQW